MKDLKIITVLLLSGYITMLFFSIPVIIFTDIKILEYITYYTFSFSIVGILYYKIIGRYYFPISLGILVITIILLTYYFGAGTQVAILCALATTLAILLTIKCTKYFND